MDKQQVNQILFDVVTEIQSLSGRPLIPITEQTQPISELPGFDSLIGLEATVELAHRLGYEVGTDINFFVDPKGTRALRLHEVRDRLCNLLNLEEVSHDR